MARIRLLFNRLDAPGLAFVFCCLIIAGMFTTHFARSLSSIGTAGLTLTAIFWAVKNKTFGDLRQLAFLAFIEFTRCI